MTKIPYKINLSEDELPKYWQNIRPYMQEAPDPFINPVTFKPCTADDLRPVFCDELIEQELDNTNKFIEISFAWTFPYCLSVSINDYPICCYNI